MFGVDQVSDFVVNREADSSADAVSVEEISGPDEEEVEIVDGGRLNDPVHAGRKKVFANLRKRGRRGGK